MTAVGHTFQGRPRATSVAAQQQLHDRVWRRVYFCGLATAALCAGWTYLTAPRPLVATLLVYLAASLWIFARPVAGVYVVVFLTLLGDTVVAPWYPFAKNLSSRESISFLSDSLPITPIELLLGVTTLAWLLQMFSAHSWQLVRGVLLWPSLVFGAFVAFGLARTFAGVGDFRVGMFEGRALLYLPVLYWLIVQLFKTSEQYHRLMVVAIVAILGQALLALNYYAGLDAETIADLESLTEHSASVHLGSVFVMLLASFLLSGCSWSLRLGLLAVSVPGVVVFALSQRRSAFIGLSFGVVLLLIALARVRPRRVAWFAPLVVVVAIGYLGAFWNSEGPVAIGAQAIKSVISPEELGEADFSSNIYREIEAYNLWFTVRVQPLTGVGFGNPFYQPWPLPFLEGFEFRYFIPHNNLLWIWLKMGVGGFVTTLYLIARAVQHGAASVGRLATGNAAAIAMGSVGYVAMFTIFAYVDIAWDARSTVFLAVTMAWCADYLRVADPATPPLEEADEVALSESRTLVRS